jgi:hypothetical protein
MSAPLYPQVVVNLSGEDGNAYAIMARVATALRHGGVSGDRIADFRAEATSGTYDNVLRTCMKWVTVT